MKNATITLLVLLVLLMTSPMLAETEPEKVYAKLPVKEVTIFKDGHAYVLHEGTAESNENGDVVLDELPKPVMDAPQGVAGRNSDNTFINGWMDAEPEIAMIKPDMYVVNEDGDKDIKQQFCEEHGIEYKVLKRLPKPGLTKRTSTNLRGF